MSHTKLDSQGSAERVRAVSVPMSLDILVSVEIEAEVRRILYALATPEYMEAWLQLPEADRIECHPDRRSFDKFRIDLFSSGTPRGSIHASCFLSKPNKITYLWEMDQSGSGARSIVEFRLWNHLSKCTLSLRHFGSCDPEERERHSTMWHRSLNTLRGLIEGTGGMSGNLDHGD
jgi:uncharacterized protein YndB with AHSA1/START domain